MSNEFRQALARAVEAKGAGYEPRTRHRLPDGGARYTNRLILESSPYLLQHAHNPVNWYPWGDEAFLEAKRSGRPVLLSIGYSTCHWCHVMEEESFEDEEIAAYLNANYVAIKVDREERPDVDAVYMSAVQSLTGRGGWPMTTWLTPERIPFYGGTYFPARDGDRGTRMGFLTLLARLKVFYDTNPEKVVEQATTLVERVQASLEPEKGGSMPTAASLDTAMNGYRASFDKVHGGLSRAPKFPSTLPVRLLLREYERTGQAHALEMATLTLSKMGAGGMYDQVGGGFHRYSTDVEWLVPHFEKMLYDNALLSIAYLEAYQLTGNEEYERIVREILEYVAREMTAPGGGFYSATDADSLNSEGEREEGWFFTWTPQEIAAVVGADDARLVVAYYGVRPRGNFEGRSIFHVERPLDAVAADLGLEPAELESRLAAAKKKLYAARAFRPAPLRDDKIITSWNGLMISAMARGAFVLQDASMLDRASRAAKFVLENLVVDGRLRRTYNVGQARFEGYLDDYAFFVAALLDLFESTSELLWLTEAIRLQAELDLRYRDREAGGYFMTAADAEVLLAREKPAYDGAEPAGNSVALMNLLRLSELTLDDAYRASADEMLRGFSTVLNQRPTAVAEMLLALDFKFGRPKEVVIVTAGEADRAEPFLSVLRRSFVPRKVVIVVRGQGEQQKLAKTIPLVQGKTAKKGNATAYVCEAGVCRLPTTDVTEFERQLRAKPDTPGNLDGPKGD
jgi:uncharacterized protein YyaL (SSP411 family)